MTPTDALFGFAAWLTCREATLTLGGYHEAGPVVEALTTWMKANGLPDVSEEYPKNITQPSLTV
jgi:hypothetical protein